MARTALPILAILLLTAPVQAKKPKTQDAAPSAEACESSTKDLEKKLEMAQQENAALKKQVGGAASLPYLSTEVIISSLTTISDFTQANVDSTSTKFLSETVLGWYDLGMSLPRTATPLASQGLSVATDVIYSTVDMAKDLHGKHAAHHTDEYYRTTIEAYTVHVEPHVSTARKAYYDNVHSHLGKVHKTISDGVGTTFQGGKSTIPMLWELIQTTMKSVSATMSTSSSGPLAKQLGFLVTARSFTLAGRKFDFNHGCLDIALVSAQVMFVFYFLFKFVWKLFLKTIVWNIGVKLLGKKVFLGLTASLVKVSYRLVRLFVSIALYLVFTVIAIAFSWLMIAICGGLGVGMLHGVEKNFKVGLSAGMRLSVGAGAGLLFYLICRCTCCKRRKADKHVNGKSKAASKVPAKTDSKRAAAPSKANGKKK